MIHPLQLSEILRLVAANLAPRDQFACIRVNMLWYQSVLPVLWRNVSISHSGPDFENPDHVHLHDQIRQLEVRVIPLPQPVPLQVFSSLNTLKVTPKSVVNPASVESFWQSFAAVIELLGLLGKTQLAHIDISHDPATNPFWHAIYTLQSPKSLTVRNVNISGTFHGFWRACTVFESIQLQGTHILSKTAHPLQPFFNRRFFRLKQLDIDEGCILKWANGPSLPWLRLAPNLEIIRCSSPTLIASDLTNLVRDIEGATTARQQGRAYYGPKGMEHLIEFSSTQGTGLYTQRRPSPLSPEELCEIEQNQNAIPGAKIRVMECTLPKSYHTTMNSILDTTERLERFWAQGVHDLGRPVLGSLDRHAETLVEVDLWWADLPQERLLSFLEHCPQLEVFAANNICAAVAARRPPWVCTRLRLLRVLFYSDEIQSQQFEDFPTTMDIRQEQVNILNRLGSLTRLEKFCLPVGWHFVGMEPLVKELRKVQLMWVTSLSSIHLAEEDFAMAWPDFRDIVISDDGIKSVTRDLMQMFTNARARVDIFKS
ncbi:hypothetical protein BG004_005810 [Podila humilis]|nr:hypothetical protein BG004_005810 [Podila humilis]